MYTFRELKKACKNNENCGKKKISTGRNIKIAVIGDTATQFLTTAIQGDAILRGFNVSVWEADYNQVEMQIMDLDSELHRFGADYTVVFQSTHKLLEKYSLSDLEGKSSLADDRIEFIKAVCESTKGRIIYYNYPEIDDTVFGSFAAKVESSFVYQLTKLNYYLNELANEHQNLFICNLSGLSAKLGRDFVFDRPVYTNTEMVLSLNAIPYVASRTVDIILAAEGYAKKCLILDLDNTLWGGIVGDDGWENIQIGHGLGIGKAFTEFQQWVKKLKERGIIICICSKNDEDKAKEPFEKNPEMVLKLDDIAVFVANWNDKVSNIQEIQQVLNIGFDSMVFLDDNPFERNMVRESIPNILVPELPEDPAEYLEYLYALNVFETASYSSNDRDRTRQYQVEAKRVSAQKSFSNEQDFLKSLNMISKVEEPNTFNIPRIAQLSQRSNQFNLRTLRYTNAEVEARRENEKYKVLAFTLEDKFGDNGYICVVSLEEQNKAEWFIENWYMSCRVLKRGMEQFVLNTIVDLAKEKGINTIVGEYIPTAKNGMVQNHYSNLGFSKIEDNRYLLDLSNYKPLTCFISKEK